MPRFSLRTLIFAMLFGGPVCAWVWYIWESYQWFRALDRMVLTGDSSQLDNLRPLLNENHFFPLNLAVLSALLTIAWTKFRWR